MSIFHKIKFHPSFYIILLICSLTGNFRKIAIFTILILVHEIGHFTTAYLLGWKVNKIYIYPFGGCSEFNNDINVSINSELLVTIMGPLVQILFVLLLGKFIDIDNYIIFKEYSRLIIFFNMLPIYPLDGGKIFDLILSYFISYYDSLRISIYISFFLFINLFLIVLFFKFNIILLIIILLLGLSILRENKKINLYFDKFLLERCINKYNFKKIKRINKTYQMKREHYHIINNILEKEYLNKFFYYK